MVWFQMCFVDCEAVDSCGEVHKTRAISRPSPKTEAQLCPARKGSLIGVGKLLL